MARSREQREDDYADADRRFNEHGSGDRKSLKMPPGLKMFKSKREGDYEIDIVPYCVSPRATRFSESYAAPGKRYWERTFYVHYGVGPNEDQVCCLAKTFGKPCPVCEHKQKLLQNPNLTEKEREKVMKDYRPKERQLFLVYDRKEPEKGIQLWEIANFNFGANLDDKINGSKKKDTYKWFWKTGTDGFTLRIIAKSQSAGKEMKPFNMFRVDEFLDREEPLPEKIANHKFCLDEIPVEMPYKDLAKLFHFKAEEEDGEPEDEETAEDPEDPEEEGDEPEEDESEEAADQPDVPTKGMKVQWKYKGKTKSGTVVKVNKVKGIAEVEVDGQDTNSVVDFEELEPAEEEEEDPFEEEESEEEEEEEKPPAKKPGKKPAPKEEEEDDPFDDEESEEDEPEEEETKPRRRPGKK